MLKAYRLYCEWVRVRRAKRNTSIGLACAHTIGFSLANVFYWNSFIDESEIYSLAARAHRELFLYRFSCGAGWNSQYVLCVSDLWALATAQGAGNGNTSIHRQMTCRSVAVIQVSIFSVSTSRTTDKLPENSLWDTYAFSLHIMHMHNKSGMGMNGFAIYLMIRLPKWPISTTMRYIDWWQRGSEIAEQMIW